jgi:hypothetical protein
LVESGAAADLRESVVEQPDRCTAAAVPETPLASDRPASTDVLMVLRQRDARQSAQLPPASRVDGGPDAEQPVEPGSSAAAA